MKICSSKESAITFLGESNHNNSLQYPLSIKANCKCRNPFFWILQKAKYIENKSVLQVYKCATVSNYFLSLFFTYKKEF